MQNPRFRTFPSAELPQDRRLRLGAERLLVAAQALPERYAPFLARLANLWELPEALVQRELTRAREPRSWRATLLPGLRTFDVAGASAARGERPRARLLRFQPHVVLPRHRHRGTEHVLVLEGAYQDHVGERVAAGDSQTMLAGSEHELTILGPVPCVAAVSERGVDFEWSRFLRAAVGPLFR